MTTTTTILTDDPAERICEEADALLPAHDRDLVEIRRGLQEGTLTIPEARERIIALHEEYDRKVDEVFGDTV